MKNLIIGIVGGLLIAIVFIDSVKLRQDFYDSAIKAGQQIIQLRNEFLAEFGSFEISKQNSSDSKDSPD